MTDGDLCQFTVLSVVGLNHGHSHGGFRLENCVSFTYMDLQSIWTIITVTGKFHFAILMIPQINSGDIVGKILPTMYNIAACPGYSTR